MTDHAQVLTAPEPVSSTRRVLSRLRVVSPRPPQVSLITLP